MKFISKNKQKGKKNLVKKCMKQEFHLKVAALKLE